VTYRFRWTCSYMGEVDYEVTGGPVQTARLRLRTEASDYEKSIFNHAAGDWEREVVGSIGLLRSLTSRFTISQQVVDAFNAWRQAEHEALVKMIRDNPHKYGELVDGDPLLVAPVPARGAHYQVGTGWIVLPEMVERDCMRCEQTFSLPADADHDFCPACRRNPNRIVLE
jgi:hypothetical protein